MQEDNKLALVHRTRPAQSTDGGAPPLLILLHGIGSNEHDLFSMAPSLDPRFLILSARAPYALGTAAYAWFEVVFRPEGNVINRDQASESRQLLLDFIPQAIATYAADPRRVYLLGFSQGAIMSAAVALQRPQLIAGAALMSGRIPAELTQDMAPAEQLAGLPLLVVHGTEDTVLPIHYGRAARQLLSMLPVELTYREYPMGHQVSQASLADISAWLSACLDHGIGG